MLERFFAAKDLFHIIKPFFVSTKNPKPLNRFQNRPGLEARSFYHTVKKKQGPTTVAQQFKV
jgi:hypothetical protein